MYANFTCIFYFGSKFHSLFINLAGTVWQTLAGEYTKDYLWKKMEMILLVQVSCALLGMLAVIFGAFGAHRLKRTLSDAQLRSFETGIKYQFYHALLLLVLGFNLGFTTRLDNLIGYCFILGVLLFSFSIYLLCLLASKGKRFRFLGMVTPLGGLLLVTGWALLLYSFFVNMV